MGFRRWLGCCVANQICRLYLLYNIKKASRIGINLCSECINRPLNDHEETLPCATNQTANYPERRPQPKVRDQAKKHTRHHCIKILGFLLNTSPSPPLTPHTSPQLRSRRKARHVLELEERLLAQPVRLEYGVVLQ